MEGVANPRKSPSRLGVLDDLVPGEMHNAMPPPAGITPVTMDLYSTHATAANGTNNPASGQGLPLTGSGACAMCHRSKINGDHGASSGICAQCARGSSSSQGEPEQDHDR